MAGSLGRVIDKVYAESVEAPLSEFIRKGNTNFTRDLELFVKLLQPEHFFRHSPGRHFKSYRDFSFSIEAKHPEKLKKKLCQLSKRLDKIRRCTDKHAMNTVHISMYFIKRLLYIKYDYSFKIFFFLLKKYLK